jgi:D-3-phosphoglycerate dehydrogenase / 2-oxoglutarate reductase
MTILITEPDNYSEHALKLYRDVSDVWLRSAPLGRENEVRILVVRLGRVLDNEYLSDFPLLKAIVTPTTGLTHICLNACKERGVEVFSLASCRSAIERVTSTSELTIGLIIALIRRIPVAHHDVIRNNEWERDKFRSRQLSRLVLGIVGLGRIGGHVAKYAKVMGMRVLAFDPFQSPERFAALGVEKSELKEVLTNADILSLHANLTEDNNGLIGDKEIYMMPYGAYIVNTARGALLNQFSAVDALRSGHLAGVAVDVLTEEHGGSLRDSALVQAAKEGFNAIITPHIGGCTSDAMHITEEAMADLVVREFWSQAS